MNTFFPVPLLASILCTAASPAPPVDPLFEKMLGQWEGSGIRTQTVSGRTYEVHSLTSTSITPPPGHDPEVATLFSHNEVSERPLEGPNPEKNMKSYLREYWIRPTLNQQGHYDFLTEKNSELRVSSTGVFHNDTLEVGQKIMLGNSILEVHSQTRFIQLPNGTLESDYQDETFLDGRLTSKSHMTYR